MAGGTDLGGGEVVAAVQGLVEKSLLAVRQGNESSVFRMLDTTRAYARERLAEAEEQHETSRRHAAQVLARLERPRPASGAAILGDVHAALHWSFADPAQADLSVRLSAAASRLFIALSLLNECRRWSERALSQLDAIARNREAETALYGALGHALMFTDGNGEEARAALERALLLARELGDRPAQFRLLNRLNMYHRRCGDIASLLPISRKLEALGTELGQPVAVSAALTQLSVAFHLRGDQREARSHLEAVLRMDLFKSVPPDHFAFHRHPFIALSRCLWLLGYPDRALELARPLAQETIAPDTVTYCIGLIWGASVFEWSGDWPMVGRLAERLVAHARSHSLRPYQAVGLGLQGKVLLEAGQPGPASALLRSSIASLRADRYELYTASFEGSLAVGLVASGLHDSAREVIDGAIERILADGETCDLPELLRIRGEIQARQGLQPDALASFDEAMAMAERQGALSWSLRTAMSRLLAAKSPDARLAARHTLEAVYGRFLEGFGTADLLAARRLIDRANPAR